MRLINGIINLKNMVINSVFVRLIWTIAGAVAGVAGLTYLAVHSDLWFIKTDGKPRLFNNSIYEATGVWKPEPEKKVEKPKARVYKKTNARAKKVEPEK